jgi:hypothetical protein
VDSVEYLDLGVDYVEYLDLGVDSVEYLDLGVDSVEYLDLGVDSVEYLDLGVDYVESLDLGVDSVEYLEARAAEGLRLPEVLVVGHLARGLNGLPHLQGGVLALGSAATAADLSFSEALRVYDDYVRNVRNFETDLTE